ncbi:MAG: phage major capsid protein [Thermoleophilaceae bacterium]|nr:phage major capsid protein [Thermoleophilaceae bacterium]
MPYNNLISRTDATAAIPEEVSRALIRSLIDDAGVLGSFTSVPVARGQVRMPVLSALPVAYFVNGDTGLKQTSEVNWANKYLNVEEIACIVPVPEAVLDDVDMDLWGEIEPLVRDAISRSLDAAVFFGANAPGSWPTSVVTAAVAAGNVITRGTNAATAGGIAGDISDLLGTLEVDGYDATDVIASSTYKGRLRNARNADGDRHPEVNQNAAYDATVRYPMRGLWPTGLNAAEMVALDRSHFVVGVRQDITMKILDQAVITDNTNAIVYNLPQQDMVAARFVFRVGWQVSNAINYDQATEASRFPAAVLRSPAA